MASGDIINYTKETLPKSGPGEVAEVDVTVSGIQFEDIVNTSISNVRPVTTTGDSFNVYATIGSTGATGKVSIKSNRPQTPEVTVDLIVIEK